MSWHPYVVEINNKKQWKTVMKRLSDKKVPAYVNDIVKVENQKKLWMAITVDRSAKPRIKGFKVTRQILFKDMYESGFVKSINKKKKLRHVPAKKRRQLKEIS